ncbi:MAG: Uma2 family endonuclease [bacterium]|jgi:Uma2 family endonuclease|nr:Uma2 family endonuclease [Phycisphaerales bacterium]MCE2652520.1 Uma2 family endonuclease [Planctomycetaceae bacterium]
MSAAPRFPHQLGYAGLRMTADDYLSLGETADRYELIDGVVVMSPSPSPQHGDAVAELIYQLKAFARLQMPGARVLAETDLRLADTLVYRPDVMVFASTGQPARAAARLQSPPDLLIEVLSPSSMQLDLVTKRDDYGRFGVREYWVVDPADGAVRCFRLEAGVLQETAAGGDRLASAAVAGLVLDLTALRTALGR